MIKKISDKCIRFINKPIRWGMIYLSMIPIYALVYRFLIPTHIDFGRLGKSFLSSIYFSISAITTLGIGDISPDNLFSSIIVASECLLGVIIIGLFLNSLSYKQSQELAEKDNADAAKAAFEYEKTKVLQLNKIIQISMMNYKNGILMLLEDDGQLHHVEEQNEFPVEQMTRLFQPAFSIDNFSLKNSNIYYFYKCQDCLLNDIRELIKEVNLEYWPLLEQLCAEFIIMVTQNDNREFFLPVTVNSTEAAQMTLYIKDFQKLSVDHGSKDESFQPFIQLNKVVNGSLVFIYNYFKEIESIKSV